MLCSLCSLAPFVLFPPVDVEFEVLVTLKNVTYSEGRDVDETLGDVEGNEGIR